MIRWFRQYLWNAWRKCDKILLLLCVLANAFGLMPISLTEYAVAIGIGACIIPMVEIIKLIQRAAAKKHKK